MGIKVCVCVCVFKRGHIVGTELLTSQLIYSREKETSANFAKLVT